MKNLLEVRKARQSLREVEYYLLASPLGELLYRFLLHCESFTLEEGRCWEWRGAINSDGYGHLSIGRKYFLGSMAHRLSYSLFREPIKISPRYFKEEKYVSNSCDNKKCVRPSHLYLQTSKECANNYLQKVRDGKVSKAGHMLRGKLYKILTNEEVLERNRIMGFIQSLRESEFPVKEIAWQCSMPPKKTGKYIEVLNKQGFKTPRKNKSLSLRNSSRRNNVAAILNKINKVEKYLGQAMVLAGACHIENVMEEVKIAVKMVKQAIESKCHGL